MNTTPDKTTTFYDTVNQFIEETGKTVYQLSYLTATTTNAYAAYYYHTDHLGSSSWISNSSGTAQQYLVYLPFGETLLDRRANTNWNTMFSFSGKERDLETGYSYFGARYYDAGTSIWLSVDPMSDKYPSMSPYAYCANNPLKYIDPTGMKIDPASETEWNNEKQAIMDRKGSIDGEINRLTVKAEQKGWSENKFNRKTGDLKDRSASLDKTLNTMSNLENCQNTTYTLKTVADNGYFGQGRGKDADKMVIAYSSTYSFVHEVTHGGQYHNREIGFEKGMRVGYDLTDEVNAYKAALAYSRYSYDNTYYHPSQITTDWVRNRGSGNNFPYKNLPEGPINLHVDKLDRKRNYTTP